MKKVVSEPTPTNNPRIPEINVKISWSEKVKKSELYHLKNSQDCAAICRDLLEENIHFTESMVLLLLNRNNKVLGFKKLSSGGITGTVLDARVVFFHAVHTPGCTGIILAHNHPSGNLQPSEADIRITRQIKQGGH